MSTGTYLVIAGIVCLTASFCLSAYAQLAADTEEETDGGSDATDNIKSDPATFAHHRRLP